MTKLTVTTDAEFEALSKEFNDWFRNRSTMSNLFADAKGICRGIVMEYLANQQGKTIYTHIAKVQND